MLGGPGAGKSTQAQRLSSRLNIPVISARQILQEAIARQTPLGLVAKPYLEKGELVPDEMMIDFMRQKLSSPEIISLKGWLLEGYPRTAFQAEELDFLLEEIQQNLERAIYLEVPEEVMKQRSLSRSFVDDTEAIITKRISQFHERTVPILDYYQSKKKLLTISALDSQSDVENNLIFLLNYNH
jgi:adenylate kinase